MRKDFNELKTSLGTPKISIRKDAVYTNKEIRQILGVEERLIKKYRDDGLLTFHRIGDKYWYQGEDILKFLAAGTHLGGTNLDFQMELYIYRMQ